MLIKSLLTLAVTLLAFAVPTLAADPPQVQLQQQEVEQVYGSQLMTPEERAQHRERMRNAENEAEREKIRSEHHEQMRIRAEQQGVILPEEVPAYAPGRGKGPGPGGGMGSGQGGGR
jgi:hypothetical protein